MKALLRKSGDWQKFKGLPAPKPLKVAEPKDKEAEEATFQAVLKELVLPGQEESGKAENKGKSGKKSEKAEKQPAQAGEKSEGEA